MKNSFSKIKFPRLRKPNNLKVVVLCVTTAATFWLFSALNKNYDTSLRYPIKWGYDPDTYIAINELPDRIQMNVSGLGWNLVRASMGLKVDPLTIRLTSPSLQKKIPGVSLANNVAEELEGLVLNYIVDDTLYLDIDQRGTRSFAVYVDSANISMAANYKITSPINYNVHLMELRGPLTMLQQMPSDSFLVSLNTSEIDEDYDQEIAFTIDRQDLFTFRPAEVQVTFAVNEFVQRQSLVPIETINFPEDGNLYPADSMVNVLFSTQFDSESLVPADSFQVVADYNKFNPNDSTILISIKKHPENLQDVRLEHPQTKVIHNE